MQNIESTINQLSEELEQLDVRRSEIVTQLTQLQDQVEQSALLVAARTYSRWQTVGNAIVHEADNPTGPNRQNFTEYELHWTNQITRWKDLSDHYSSEWKNRNIQIRNHYTEEFRIHAKAELIKKRIQDIKLIFFPDQWC